ncbi:MAG: hypothetical protein B6U72_00155 [Candidatus Altiarchaeales archaeon ex4484_2]|nr:MAG: hypothetical protein B6U72_00155 [Candidatus Altiarchaeales archaeon ex4484_2]
MRDTAGKLEDELTDVLAGEIILLETKPEETLDTTLSSLKTLTSGESPGIILTSTRPYSKLIKLCRENNINTEHLSFIDTIMMSVGVPEKNAEETTAVIYVSSTSALTEISLALDKKCSNLGEGGFLFIDSLTTLLIHNSPVALTRFIHYTLTRLRVRDMGALLTTMEEGIDSKTRAEIVTLCDKTVIL